MAFTLTSPAFAEGETIPAEYTCDESERVPGLAWRGAPDGTRSFALILHDPDTPKGDLTHWVLYNIPAGATGLPAGFVANTAGSLGMAGTSSMGLTHYKGPCPPPGDKPHRYIFEFYALDMENLNLPPGAQRAEVEAAAEGHTLAKAVLRGLYGR